ncbi:hypothetical protein [Endozoicomonas arenosclerae]|uniref:hypothetical protein n=1 Tax=Endozoicomonas arenosclerae TaxID=1633495 RepID=UPI000781E1EF|nr:hypothetical protein [Endozoicomonas arenosclerae]
MTALLKLIQTAVLFFITAFHALHSWSADKILYHFGEPQEHIVSVELIESKSPVQTKEAVTPGEERHIKHLCTGYLTEETLIVSGKHAKKIRSFLSGKIPYKFKNNNTSSKVKIKVFSTTSLKGAAYIDEIPDPLLNTKWSDHEPVALPLKSKSRVKSTWKETYTIEPHLSSRSFMAYQPVNHEYGTHDNGQRTLLTLSFDLDTSGGFCTSRSCKLRQDLSEQFVIDTGVDRLLLGISNRCTDNGCPISEFTRTETQYLRDSLYLGFIFICLASIYFFAPC